MVEEVSFYALNGEKGLEIIRILYTSCYPAYFLVKCISYSTSYIPTNLLSSSGFCIPSASSLNVYYFVDKNMTWSDAQDYCIDHHTNLAEILNKENLTTMMNTAAGGYKYKAWIGLSRMMFFRWVDGKKITFTNWETGEPDQTGEENCAAVELQNGTWTDEQCNATYPFFCYGSMNHIYLVLKLELDARHDIAAVFCCTHHILSAEVESMFNIWLLFLSPPARFGCDFNKTLG
uniref:C-type lectin domain-containing protein n=1 Tax=Sparus aurata TaxID=8175 RepID=A0A671WMJ4_SPAAU